MLLKLPVELRWVIWGWLDSLDVRYRFLFTCRSLYETFNASLYRDAVKEGNDSLRGMQWAALSNKIGCMKAFLKYGADPALNDRLDIRHDNLEPPGLAQMETWFVLDSMYWTDMTPLSCAAESGSVEMTQLLLEAGVNVNAHGGYGDVPLNQAVRNHHTETVSILLQAGASKHIPAGKLPTLLQYAVQEEALDCVKLLFLNDYGDDNWNSRPFNQLDWDTAFDMAICSGYENMVRVFIEAGSDINRRFPHSGETPLERATFEGSKEMITLLLDLGAHLEEPNELGITPLHYAISNNLINSVKILLRKGASTETVDFTGYTPLACAVIMDNPGIVEALLEHNAAVDAAARPQGPDTPLLLAIQEGSAECAESLLPWGANPGAVNKDRYTGLCLAIILGHTHVAMVLLRENSYQNSGEPSKSRAPDWRDFIDTPDSLGRTPLFLATMYGFKNVARMILRNASRAIHTPTRGGRTPMSFAHMNKDKSRIRDTFSEDLDAIFELLQDPSKAASGSYRAQDKASSEDEVEEENTPDEAEETDSDVSGFTDGSDIEAGWHDWHKISGYPRRVCCDGCFAPVSDHDQFLKCLCITCEYNSQLCPECNLTGNYCRLEEENPYFTVW